MTSHLFIFGRTPALSALELQVFTPSPTLVTPSVALVPKHALNLTVETAVSELGGVVKIAEVLGSIRTPTPEALVPYIIHTGGRVTFGVSVYGGQKPIPTQTLSRIKDILATGGVTARYIIAREPSLSSVAVVKEHITELVLVESGGQWIVGRTVGIQPFEDWARRDYGRPFSDPRTGMLPPKVARMIVNIALGPDTTGKVLYDPFCGMGTILAEALMRGAVVYGSDQSDDAVVQAKANLAWLVKNYPSRSFEGQNLFVSEASHASRVVAPSSVDAVVTEPFMGSTAIAQRVSGTVTSSIIREVKNTIRGLEKLYIGCLKDWRTILKGEGKVVIALPVYAVGSREYFVKRVIDTLGTLGYTTLAGPIDYGRPKAVVRRRFYILQKENPTNTTNLQFAGIDS